MASYLDKAGLEHLWEKIKTLVSGKADASHNHAASAITSGTLSSSRLPTVPVTKGGTGATTAADALTNLGPAYCCGTGRAPEYRRHGISPLLPRGRELLRSRLYRLRK